MNELVFIDPAKLDAVPFTTSEVIAEFAGVQHHTVTRLIQQHNSDFAEFGILRFKIEEIKGRGQPRRNYLLNEEQATLLMTYLKNTERVRAFKKELVRQFFKMRQELTRRIIARESRKPVRREMTDAIRDYIPDGPHKNMMYKHYTDLAYKVALGGTAAQLRKDRKAPKRANLAEYLTPEEADAVKRSEGRISVVIESGMDYQTIKAIVLHRLKASA